MAFHPCCGGSLQTGTKWVAIIQMIVGVMLLLLLGAMFVLGAATIGIIAYDSGNNSTSHVQTNNSSIDNGTMTGNATSTDNDGVSLVVVGAGLVFVLLVLAIYTFFTLGMGILLLKGAKQRHAWNCRMWLIIRIILVAFSFMTFVTGFFEDIGHCHTWSAISLGIDIYCIWIVYAFVTELADEENGKRPSIKRIIHNEKV